MSHNLVNKFGLHPPLSIQTNKQNLLLYSPMQTFRVDDLIHKNISRLPLNLALQPNIPLYSHIEVCRRGGAGDNYSGRRRRRAVEP
jgi:hypothetical protein